MSSLLQFSGQIDRKRGVGLLFYLERTLANGWQHEDVESAPCSSCGRDHPQLYRAWRKPRGMFGCWVVFRYNGCDQVPDLSVPIAVERLPRDAKPLSTDEAAEYWHK